MSAASGEADAAVRFDDAATYARYVAGHLRRRRSGGLATTVLSEELVGAFAVLSLVRILALASGAPR